MAPKVVKGCRTHQGSVEDCWQQEGVGGLWSCRGGRVVQGHNSAIGDIASLEDPHGWMAGSLTIGLQVLVQDSCLQGQPLLWSAGTGKTCLLVLIVAQWVACFNGNILVTADSEKAVDSIMALLHELGIEALRLGIPAEISGGVCSAFVLHLYVLL